MRRLLVCAGLLGVVVAAGCSDTTGPKSVQRVATIVNIKVPATAAATDTVKVVFDYSPASYCDTGVVMQARTLADGLHFTVTSWSTNVQCPAYAADIIRLPSAGYIVSPPHDTPLRLVFSEPDGKDSVRVVAP